MDKPTRPLLEAATTGAIIDAFRDVHGAFGFGYREYIYSLALERDLIAKGCRVDREVGLMVYYRGEPLAPQTVDMIVNEKVIVENKATERLRADTPSQLFSYLCSTNIEVGLVLHFGREAVFHRIVCENRFKRRPRLGVEERTNQPPFVPVPSPVCARIRIGMTRHGAMHPKEPAPLNHGAGTCPDAQEAANDN